MSFLPSSPGPTNLPDIFQKYPERAVLMLRLIDNILRGESPLSVAERELIFAYGSGQNACSFCFDSHKPVAAAFGIDEGVFDELMTDIETAHIDERLKPILRFVKKLTQTPARMTQADADAIFAAGWDEQAFVDAVSICAALNSTSTGLSTESAWMWTVRPLGKPAPSCYRLSAMPDSRIGWRIQNNQGRTAVFENPGSTPV